MTSLSAMPPVRTLCPHFGPCGGCRWLDAEYESQLALKHAHVIEALQRHPALAGAEVRPVLGDPQPHFYRNKALYPFAQQRGRVIAGFYRRGSHALVDVRTCLIQDPALTEMANRVREIVQELRLPIYDERRHTGFLRALLLRVASTGELMVGLVTNAGPLPAARELIDRIRAAAARGLENRAGLPVTLVSLVRNVNAERTNVVLGPQTEVLSGVPHLQDRLGGLTLRISPRSFYQVNAAQAARAYDLALEMAAATRRGRVVDAYAGIGTIALWFAGEAREVIGVEEVDDAVADARANAEANGRRNCTFLSGAVEQTLAAIDGPIDLLVLDPPRGGSSPAVIACALDKRPERIVYLSCAPRTFARDAALLVAGGYALEALQPIDFFPHTEHVELLAAFERR